ncbi:hypothetical protein PVNG_02486 [Plasmodium vivax North Korean]|uniref:Elongation factor Ts, mitochondrial n=1 Tax=Plasmodium vivax North Korean TaxID=1035514 RepID=A0A0J9TNP7_PLAVI|nr:hypothetical protein PVNG_02486 [Plasmodium vivax North Korean]
MVDKVLLVKLRRETLASFSACIEALKNSENNYEEAKKLLIKKSIRTIESSEKVENSALPEGRVHAFTSSDNKVGVMFELRSQTDFTSNSREFIGLIGRIEKILLANIEEVQKKDRKKIYSLRSSEDNLTIQESISALSSITREEIQLSEIYITPQENNFVSLAYTHHNAKLGALLTLQKNRELTQEDLLYARKLILHFSGSDSTFLRLSDCSQS